MTVKISGNSSASTPSFAGDDGDSGLHATADQVQLVTNGTVGVTVDSSQNVGVGTTTPNMEMQIKSSGGFQAVNTGEIALRYNAYYDGADKYIQGSNKAASLVLNSDGEFRFYNTNTASSSANSSITGWTERLRLNSNGELYHYGTLMRSVLNAEYIHLTGSISTDSPGSWTTLKNVNYTPKRSGSLVVCHFQVQTWWGSSVDETGDIYFRALFDQGASSYVDVTYGGTNMRATGNFDADSRRQHMFYTHQFGFLAQNTSQHVIRLQASNGNSLTTDFNWFHTNDTCNGMWIYEYDT